MSPPARTLPSITVGLRSCGPAWWWGGKVNKNKLRSAGWFLFRYSFEKFISFSILISKDEEEQSVWFTNNFAIISGGSVNELINVF